MILEYSVQTFILLIKHPRTQELLFSQIPFKLQKIMQSKAVKTDTLVKQILLDIYQLIIIRIESLPFIFVSGCNTMYHKERRTRNWFVADDDNDIKLYNTYSGS